MLAGRLFRAEDLIFTAELCVLSGQNHGNVKLQKIRNFLKIMLTTVFLRAIIASCFRKGSKNLQGRLR